MEEGRGKRGEERREERETEKERRERERERNKFNAEIRFSILMG